MFLLLLIVSAIQAVTAFSSTESLILTEIIDYFQTDYLELLDERLFQQSYPYVSNETFPARKMRLTAMVTPKELLSKLLRESFHRSGMALIAAKDTSLAWQQFLLMGYQFPLRGIKWVLFTLEEPRKAKLDNLYIPFDCQFLIVSMKSTLPMITEVYHLAKGSELKTTHFGYWDEKYGLDSPKAYFYVRRSNFEGHTFQAVVENAPPYTYVNVLENGTLEISGYFYEVWKELEFRLKFKTSFQVMDKGRRAQAFLSKEKLADFCVSPVVQNPSTASEVDLSEPVYESNIFLFGNRPGSELEWNSYLKPFSTETWLVTLAWMLISAIAMAILYFVAFRQKASEDLAGYYVFTIPICIETVFRAMCAQGSHLTPRSLSCRLLFLSIYMTALVLTSAFSAALFSLLTIPVSKAPFNTFDDVFRAKSYKIGIIPNSDIYEGIQDLAGRYLDSPLNRLFGMLEPSSQLPTTVLEALGRVCASKNYVFMWDLPNVLESMQELNRTCQEKIMPGGPMVFKEHLGFATVKNSPYKGLIDLHLVRLKNEGVLSRLLLNTWPPRIPNVQSSWVRVTLADISPILFMFALGVLVGAIILLFERLNKRLRGNVGNASKAVSQHVHSASQLLRKFNFDNSALTPADPWETRYTDWTRNASGLHRRPRDKIQ